VFPNYYSFSQDLTVRHQGKVTGTLGFCCWVAMASWQEAIGQVVQRTGPYVPCFRIAGVAPLIGSAALLLLTRPVVRGAPGLPDRMRVKITGEVNGMKFTFLRVVNGDKVWMKMGEDEASAVEGKEELAEAREGMYVENLTRLVALKGKGLTIRVIGESNVGGK